MYRPEVMVISMAFAARMFYLILYRITNGIELPSFYMPAWLLALIIGTLSYLKMDKIHRSRSDRKRKEMIT